MNQFSFTECFLLTMRVLSLTAHFVESGAYLRSQFFAESVFDKSVFAESGAFLPSQLLPSHFC